MYSLGSTEPVGCNEKPRNLFYLLVMHYLNVKLQLIAMPRPYLYTCKPDLKGNKEKKEKKDMIQYQHLCFIHEPNIAVSIRSYRSGKCKKELLVSKM